MKKIMSFVALGALSVSSYAVDKSITDKLETVSADVAILGAAVLVVLIAIKGWKLLSRAL
jgi:Inovirus Coat protein B